jgi:crotonobetainyl-CoA:carnitine CoA-transferase CaiB-like acyl-CoA transferase
VAAPLVGQHNAEIDRQFNAPPPQIPIAKASSARPLEGITVIDLSQFLSGPCAALRLADLGARVIKIERPRTGDICRELYVSNVMIDGESTVFHAINRNKESFAADLKDQAELAQVRKLVAKADVVMHNFRPGVVERLGLDFESIRKRKSDMIYGEISGYGESGPWRNKPGQDLLVQSLSGLTWLTGTSDAGPVPMGLSIIDQLAGMHLAQGILACLIRREKTGLGGLVQVSMLESALDFQFEAITVFLQDGGQPVERSARNGAHAYLGAPYGVYGTSDGFIAIAMARIPQLGELLDCPALTKFSDPQEWFPRRDEIKAILAEHLRTSTAAQWLARLEPADVWCAEVLDWKRLLAHEGFNVLGMTQEVVRGSGTRYLTTRCPIRLDGQRLYASRGSPDLGEQTQAISQEFSL